jgi:hypothetical protein
MTDLTATICTTIVFIFAGYGLAAFICHLYQIIKLLINKLNYKLSMRWLKLRLKDYKENPI